MKTTLKRQLGTGAAALVLWQNLTLAAENPVTPPPPILLKQGLAIKGVGRTGRSPVRTDAVEALLVGGNWASPKAGDTLELAGGTNQTWTVIEANADGSFDQQGLRGGYLSASMVSDEAKVMILQASGHGMVYVNGAPRGGDIYGYGYLQLPVLLAKGTNEFLFQAGRGRLRAQLAEPAKPAYFDLGDPTLPDLVVGEETGLWGAVVIVNASTNRLSGLELESALFSSRATTPVPDIAPLTSRKVPFRILGRAPKPDEKGKLALKLGRKEAVFDEKAVELRVRQPLDTRRRTFLSGQDGSAQYFGLNPARPWSPGGPKPALVLSLHGASVEAMGQADAYSGKSWCHIVAPTNRRPYGFDWEDWGRRDAIETLDFAQEWLQTDLARTYLTGHSMGGHGTWQVGATLPDRFAAIGPSAGWISFLSYGGGRRSESSSPAEEMLRRAFSPSDTLALATNYLQHGVYILHGDADDNVPVTEARTMRDKLVTFHKDLGYFEQPGAGHWWENSDEPGAECLDWPQMFDMFARHAIPRDETLRDINFTTANPVVSSRCHWLAILAQQTQLQPSSVQIRWDPGARRFVGSSTNVARLLLTLDHARPGAPLRVAMDGKVIDKIAWPEDAKIWLERKGEEWTVSARPSPKEKGPHRSGPFKEAFQHRMVFVYGTKGSAEENAWTLNKARYDAETYYYRGNAGVDIVADTEFTLEAYKDRGVILFGNADNNAAWPLLLAGSPVQARRGSVTVGDKTIAGDNLACLFLRPRPDSEIASVAVVGGTGLPGLRLTEKMPYFMAGVAYADVTVLGPEMLAKEGQGIRAVGYFGNDWSIGSGQFVYKD